MDKREREELIRRTRDNFQKMLEGLVGKGWEVEIRKKPRKKGKVIKLNLTNKGGYE